MEILPGLIRLKCCYICLMYVLVTNRNWKCPAKNFYFYLRMNEWYLFIPRKFNVSFQMRLTILNLYNSQIKSNQMLVFGGEGKTGVPGEKTSRSRVENQQTQSTYDAKRGNRTRDTLVEGERSHHCANPAPYPRIVFLHSLRKGANTVTRIS